MVKYFRQQIGCLSLLALARHTFRFVELRPGHEYTFRIFPFKILVAITAALFGIFSVAVLHDQLIGVTAFEKRVSQAFYFLLSLPNQGRDLIKKIKISIV